MSEVSVIAVDQFPFLWDFVLTGESDDKHMLLAFGLAFTPSIFLQIHAKEMSENVLNWYSAFVSLSANPQPHHYLKSSS